MRKTEKMYNFILDQVQKKEKANAFNIYTLVIKNR